MAFFIIELRAYSCLSLTSTNISFHRDPNDPKTLVIIKEDYQNFEPNSPSQKTKIHDNDGFATYMYCLFGIGEKMKGVRSQEGKYNRSDFPMISLAIEKIQDFNKMIKSYQMNELNGLSSKLDSQIDYLKNSQQITGQEIVKFSREINKELDSLSSQHEIFLNYQVEKDEQGLKTYNIISNETDLAQPFTLNIPAPSIVKMRGLCSGVVNFNYKIEHADPQNDSERNFKGYGI